MTNDLQKTIYNKRQTSLLLERLFPRRPSSLVTRQLSDGRGFTLLEVLIASAIVVGLAFLIGGLSKNLSLLGLRFNANLFTEQEMNQTLQIIIPEIRSASQSNNGSYAIAEATSTSLQIYSDVDHDGLFELVRYFVSGTIFKKGVTKPTGQPLQYSTSTEVINDLVHNIVATSTPFLYYDVNATSTFSAPLPYPVDVLKIRTIRVTLTANEGPTNTQSIISVANEATIRNLRYK